MKKLFVFNILALLFITSCSNQDEISNVDVKPPKHPIIGKWKSEYNKLGPNFIMDVQENNILRVENKNCSECIDFYNYKVVDENSMEFDYATDLAGNMMIMKITVLPNDFLKTQCRNKNEPNKNYLIDAPLMCMGNWNFQRIQ